MHVAYKTYFTGLPSGRLSYVQAIVISAPKTAKLKNKCNDKNRQLLTVAINQLPTFDSCANHKNQIQQLLRV